MAELAGWRELSGVGKAFRDLSAEEWYGLCRYEDDRNYLEFGQLRTMPLRFVAGISPLLERLRFHRRRSYIKLCLGGLGIDADAIRWEWRGEPDWALGLSRLSPDSQPLTVLRRRWTTGDIATQRYTSEPMVDPADIRL